MKQVTILLVSVGLAACARLDNRYLPPETSRQAHDAGHQQHQQPARSTPSQHLSPGNRFSAPNQPPTEGLFPNRRQPPLPRRHPNIKQRPTLQPLPSSTQIPILQYENVNSGDGNYHFVYETGNGIKFQEQGRFPVEEHDDLRSHSEADSDDGVGVVVQGSYSYPSPDGRNLVVHYVADENGFRASGDHLPTSPPIPEEIQRSLERNQVEQIEPITHDTESLQQGGPY